MAKPTPERLAELWGLCDAATVGPWNLEHAKCRKNYHHGCELRCDNSNHGNNTVGWLLATMSGAGPNANNGEFIAAARTALPEMLDAYAGLERENERLSQQVEGIRKAWGLFYQFAHTFDWTDNDAGETAWENAWTEVEMALHQEVQS